MENPGECNSCGFETEALTEYGRRRDGQLKTKWLCGLCAGSHTGIAFEYPEQFRDPMVLKTICFVGNVILAAIQERDSKPPG